MKYTAGYDRNFARQFFLRTLRDLALVVDGRILPMEIDYMAERMTETVVFSQQPRFGSPWYRGGVMDLVEATEHTDNRRLLQLAEAAANQLLVIEGVVTRGGLRDRRNSRRRQETPIDLQKWAGVLYRHASNWHGHHESERFVLRRMSANVRPWVELLRIIPGNDYLEMLGRRASTMLILPGE
jgi:hypothetical protein